MNNIALKLKETEAKIQKERQEAKRQLMELETCQKQMRHGNLFEIAGQIKPIPKNYAKLHLYNTLRGHNNKIAKVRWSSDSSKIVSASQDGFMIIWDAVSGYKKQAITLENQWVLSCDYSPSGRYLASAGLDNSCTIYELSMETSGDVINDHNYYEMYGISNQSVKSVFRGHTAYISDCEFVNELMILTGSGDLTCALWDINRGKKARDFIDHYGDVLCINKCSGHSSDIPLFISGSSDGYVKTWDARKKTPVQSFLVSESDINCVSTFSDGYSFIAGSDDGLIRWFDLRADGDIAVYSLQSHLHSIERPGLGSSASHNSAQVQSLQARNSIIDTPGVLSVNFSNSGRFIYSCYSEFGCLIWDSLKDEIVGSIGSDHSNKINQVVVSPDGVGLATASWDSTIKIWAV